ncbi:exodeoxyribonuclease VII large subunit [Aestuariirhabdus litorea]|uniref:Exodeoxyribonuclease 7 large subunit n=1 Tax=Aestuariirhabdus litorea TaxID=2528527 RepID=A0A3P3VNZ3_9GAMM|nr:exodeoxyribonuclease VII large subunit [Aestuariirhabdus litorea]RRJ83429.1 exodeoxyribonuclease VII large subunit [Aestuariirhabdus litorea]RWW93590.1 exodeoxyribonuclease VII large subunit [Endozoicomonadaceae bacterium GTF-13]
MHTTPSSPPARLSVSDLNRNVRRLLEVSFGSVWVEGEISNLARPSSGHWYFTLKDSQAQIRCAMFRNRNQAVRFLPQEGMQLAIRGKVSLYEGRGDFQLIADHMEQAGAGALQQAFEALKRKLASEGLFDPQFKQALPELPGHIAVITSPTGAAIRDILSVLGRRFPAIRVSVLPVAVQGSEAAPQIVRALQLARQLPVDLIILGRGGGSLEDLWPFNEETVARAIFDCPLPVVSAVGHETDFTISDLVADQRAATPSAAAELISPDRAELLAQLSGYQQLLNDAMRRTLAHHQRELTLTAKRLRHPGQKLQEQSQRLDELELRLRRAVARGIDGCEQQYRYLQRRLQQQQPGARIEGHQQYCLSLYKGLQRAFTHQLRQRQTALASAVGQLETLSPLATLARGYSITLSEDGQQVIRRSDELAVGQRIQSRLGAGSVISEVLETRKP